MSNCQKLEKENNSLSQFLLSIKIKKNIWEREEERKKNYFILLYNFYI